jgi:hypothetical protein
MKTFGLSILPALALGISSPALADAYIQMLTVSNTTMSSTEPVMSFNQFDPSLGTLVSVDLIWTGSLSATGIVTNTGADGHPIMASEGAFYSLLYFGGNSLGPWAPASDGFNTPGNAVTAPFILPLDAGASEQVSLSGSFTLTALNYTTVLSGFEGEGTIDLSQFIGAPDFANGPGFTFTPLSVDNQGTVELQYNFTAAVPESSTCTMLLIGFAGVGFMAYRRKQNGAALNVA